LINKQINKAEKHQLDRHIKLNQLKTKTFPKTAKCQLEIFTIVRNANMK